ncbi:MAG: CDP-diacylglycerol--glycerol-3-phosphate 3-phosphatidyltransferase [Bifidobacteriaceae bacterium]|nr:CDP-diacylglycerol--glycerol-3-phosphate 3-phosphatidyltransferase [Bifidobacteriaceae bacterium]
MSSAEADGSPTPLANIANALTLARLVLVPIFVVLLMHNAGDSTGWRWAALVVFLAAAVTDRYDGKLARSRGLVTDFGKIADPIADKALVVSALICLGLLHELSWWVPGIILARELAVTLIRFAVIRHKVMAASKAGKVKTVLQIAAISGYLLPPAFVMAVPGLVWLPPAVMVAAVAATVATGVIYVWDAWIVLQEASPAAAEEASEEDQADDAAEPVDTEDSLDAESQVDDAAEPVSAESQVAAAAEPIPAVGEAANAAQSVSGSGKAAVAGAPVRGEDQSAVGARPVRAKAQGAGLGVVAGAGLAAGAGLRTGQIPFPSVTTAAARRIDSSDSVSPEAPAPAQHSMTKEVEAATVEQTSAKAEKAAAKAAAREAKIARFEAKEAARAAKQQAKRSKTQPVEDAAAPADLPEAFEPDESSELVEDLTVEAAEAGAEWTESEEFEAFEPEESAPLDESVDADQTWEPAEDQAWEAEELVAEEAAEPEPAGVEESLAELAGEEFEAAAVPAADAAEEEFSLVEDAAEDLAEPAAAEPQDDDFDVVSYVEPDLAEPEEPVEEEPEVAEAPAPAPATRRGWRQMLGRSQPVVAAEEPPAPEPAPVPPEEAVKPTRPVEGWPDPTPDAKPAAPATPIPPRRVAAPEWAQLRTVMRAVEADQVDDSGRAARPAPRFGRSPVTPVPAEEPAVAASPAPVAVEPEAVAEETLVVETPVTPEPVATPNPLPRRSPAMETAPAADEVPSALPRRASTLEPAPAAANEAVGEPISAAEAPSVTPAPAAKPVLAETPSASAQTPTPEPIAPTEPAPAAKPATAAEAPAAPALESSKPPIVAPGRRSATPDAGRPKSSPELTPLRPFAMDGVASLAADKPGGQSEPEGKGEGAASGTEEAPDPYAAAQARLEEIKRRIGWSSPPA